jgi:hypothetical protein
MELRIFWFGNPGAFAISEDGTEDSKMYRLDTSLVRSALLVAAVIFSCSLGLAAEEQSEIRIARTNVRATGISWEPLIDFNQAVLTISGPGDVSIRKEFAKGDALRLEFLDKSFGALMDGQYAWEIRFSPKIEPMVKKALLSARESGDNSEIEALKKQGKLPAGPLVVSGYFRVKGGSIVVDKAEPPVRRGGERLEPSGSAGAVDTDSGVPTKDQVILDNLIVDGSLCAGDDCVNGESFGFDTIRIKENNLRIRAMDTSATSSFPNRDWQITFNDSANGGANKFSIDDIDGGRTPFTLEANAPTHSLYVDDGGRVGFGTSTPVVELHLVDGDTPTLRLEQDGSSGFTAQTWDVAGNELNFFIRDATNGSKLPFRIRSGAPTSAIDIFATGRVSLGSSNTPDAPLDVLATASSIGLGNAAVKMANAAGGVAFQLNADDDATFWNMSSLGGDSQFRISRSGTGNTEMFLTSSGNLNVFGDLSIGGTCAGCDAVFQPGYNLETIEEHAELMWENSYLPAVGPTQDGRTRISVFEKTTGMLNELEKAHVYIERLHMRLQQQEQAIEDLTEQFKELERAASTP